MKTEGSGPHHTGHASQHNLRGWLQMSSQHTQRPGARPEDPQNYRTHPFLQFPQPMGSRSAVWALGKKGGASHCPEPRGNPGGRFCCTALCCEQKELVERGPGPGSAWRLSGGGAGILTDYLTPIQSSLFKQEKQFLGLFWCVL